MTSSTTTPRMIQSMRGPYVSRADRGEDDVLAAGVRPAVEPAPLRLDVEAGAVEQQPPLGRREPGEMHRRRLLAAAHRQRQRPLALVPVGALEDPRLALEPAAVRVLDVLARSARRRRRRAGRPGASSSRAARERPQPVGLGRHVQQRAERDQHERDALRRPAARACRRAGGRARRPRRPRTRARPRASRPRRRRRSRGCRPSRSGRRSGRCRTPARRPGPPDARASST